MDTIINDAVFKIAEPEAITELFVIDTNGKKVTIPLVPIRAYGDTASYALAAIAHIHLQMEEMRKEIEDLKSNKVSVPEND